MEQSQDDMQWLALYYFIIIIYFKLRVGFHPVAAALQNDTQIKHITYRIQVTYTSNTQNIQIKYKYHTKYNTEKRKGSKKRNVTEMNCVLRMPRRAAPARTNGVQASGSTAKYVIKFLFSFKMREFLCTLQEAISNNNFTLS
jgi:hypothetical protein